MRHLLLFLLLFPTLVLRPASTFRFGTSVNPQGTTFEVDARGFLVGGRRVLPVMGEVHYTRLPRADWRRELRKMKAGGITIVATYVFWNHHAAAPDRWDWSGQRDLRAFLQACRDEQLPVVLRLGPFCHGEAYQGGIPDWAVKRAQEDPARYKLRSSAPGFLAEVDTLYRQIYRQAEGLLWKDGGPVVGVQIENECRGPWAYLMALKQRAVAAGFDTPFYTRTGWPRLTDTEEYGQMLPLYGDYADGFWDRTLRDMPGAYPRAFTMKDERMSRAIATETLSAADLAGADTTLLYPYLTCELGGGMMPSYHRRIRLSGREAQALAVCKLGSGSNLPGYYMYHGGRNPDAGGRNMAECQASQFTNHNDLPHISYDFQAPLGEMGQPLWEAYHTTRWLHQLLHDWGEQLAEADPDSLTEHYARRGPFTFRNTYVRLLHEGGTASVTPRGLRWQGLTLTSTTLQPFAKADGGLYFIPAGTRGEGPDTVPDRLTLNVDGRDYPLPLDQPTLIAGHTFTVLSPRRARAAYVIDGRLRFAPHGGILYTAGDSVTEETWQTRPTRLKARLRKKAAPPREVKMGRQKVAEQPSDDDFQRAAVYTLTGLTQLVREGRLDDRFLAISYEGDCARLYADGRLVQDNFWNGRPMMVRLADLAGRRVELRILPLSRDYPIYLQAPERDLLRDAPQGKLLRLTGINLTERGTNFLFLRDKL